MFHVGQKVVCIHHHPEHMRQSWAVYAEKGSIYTVRDVSPHFEKIILLLKEIKNEDWANGVEYGFNAEYFRPLEERKTDISIFTAILTPKKVRVEA